MHHGDKSACMYALLPQTTCAYLGVFIGSLKSIPGIADLQLGMKTAKGAKIVVCN